MKVTFNWLKQYVDFDGSPEELAERLTMLGVEVEGLEKRGGEFEGVVVAQVVTREKHPNADKLSVCRVQDGRGERQIVCGAHNFQAGDKVPLILPGARLPARPGAAPFLIKVGKIRGIESQGMMCSPSELGLPGGAEGLLILRPDARVGQPFAEYLGRAGLDVALDLEITPNRPDWNSVIGIARELAAATGNTLRFPGIPPAPPAPGERAEELVAVRLEAPELCPRYTARVVRGVKIGPSPDWLRSALEQVGIRSVNNVVDVTNFVMMECGQPLHAFDYRLLGAPAGTARPTIVVRRAAEGEKFVTLDGQERTLTPDMLLIADETRAVALAGIMGGQNSEIQPSTVEVLIESACFDPRNVRASSKKLGLRTESSYRFERGVDPGGCDWASRRAAQLILETAGGSLAGGVVDACPQPIQPKEISLRHDKVKALLGIELSPEQIEGYLTQLELRVSRRQPRPVGGDAGPAEPVTFRIPSFRVDLKREIDLIEEVARLYGVDRIPATPPRGAIGSNSFDAVHDQYAEARQILLGLGLSEAQGQTLISEPAARLAAEGSLAPLANPLSSDMNVLRPSLLPGLLDTLRHNLSQKSYDVALFEIGRVFASSPTGQFREVRRLAVALTGQRQPEFWSGVEREARFDVFDLKGRLEEFFEQFGIRGLAYQRRSERTPLLLESAVIQLGKFQVGELGVLLPSLGKAYDLRDPVLLAELDLDQLLARRNPVKAFKPLPAYPSVRRDVAMLAPEAVTHEVVLRVVKQARPADLESVTLFDIFRGPSVPAGRKSLAYAFIYRSPERTLTDAEVNSAHEKLVRQLQQSLEAMIRE